MKKIKIAAVVIAVMVLLPMLLWYAAVPDSAVQDLLTARPLGPGLTVEAANLHKGVFFSFKADSISAVSRGKEALVFSDVHGRIDPLAIFLFHLHVPFRAKLAQGTVKGAFDYGLFSGKKNLQVRFDSVQISDLPPIKRSVSGVLNANLSFSGGIGNFLFTLQGLSNFPYGFRSANGVIGIKSPEVSIRSVSLEAPDTYAKVKGSGNLEDGSYNLTLEITKNLQVTNQGENAGPALNMFEKSPGYYVIPLSGRLQQFL